VASTWTVSRPRSDRRKACRYGPRPRASADFDLGGATGETDKKKKRKKEKKRRKHARACECTSKRDPRGRTWTHVDAELANERTEATTMARNQPPRAPQICNHDATQPTAANNPQKNLRLFLDFRFPRPKNTLAITPGTSGPDPAGRMTPGPMRSRPRWVSRPQKAPPATTPGRPVPTPTFACRCDGSVPDPGGFAIPKNTPAATPGPPVPILPFGSRCDGCVTRGATP
jgi:hypothetical protein